MTSLQVALIDGSNALDDLKGDLLNSVNLLRMNLNPVKEKAETIKEVRSQEFWDAISLAKLEHVRTDLRSIMQYVQTGSTPPISIPVIDVAEDEDEIKTGNRSSGLISIDQAAYRKRVEEALKDLFESSPTLQKIRAGRAVSEDDLQSLVRWC